ncbi:MAG: DUF1836 domain-containing protein [Ruminococcus sp.]|nr:DUF1836 domain-containing protein [Ruminococcus sp.]
MNRKIPGTTLKFTEQARDSAFTLITPVLEATGGLTLSQLSKLTGLEGSTIQNWIKRGWISATHGKKYSEKQVIRILLINMLRGAMKLEDIAKLMRYVNGDVEDTSDDIIADVFLYNILCSIIFTAEDEGSFESKSLKKLINKAIEESKGVITDSEKLKKPMYVMIMAYRSSFLKQEMETVLAEVLNESI